MAVQHYTGGCQCGAVSFEVDLDLEGAISCNCSRCKPMGLVLAFAPRDRLDLKSGEDDMTEFLFNKHVIRHLFCRTCGVQSFAYGRQPDGTEMVAVNVNCLEGVDARDLEVKRFDGRSA